MTKHFCDRCGKEGSVREIGYEAAGSQMVQGYFCRVSDLCDSCIDEIKKPLTPRP